MGLVDHTVGARQIFTHAVRIALPEPNSNASGSHTNGNASAAAAHQGSDDAKADEPAAAAAAAATGVRVSWYFRSMKNDIKFGVTNTNYNIDASSGDVSPTGGSAVWDSRDNGASAFLYLDGTSSVYGYSFTVNDVVMVAFDADTRKIWFGKNGIWNTGDPAAGTSEAAILTSGFTYTPFADGANTTVTQFNFGQRAFAYTAPSGFKALCTQNLPTPTIGATSTTQADNHFGVALYSGTGSGNSNVVSGLEFTTDFWWQKARNASTNHYLQDAVRGFGASKSLSSNTTGSEGFNGTPLTQSLSVSSTGFTVSGSDFNGNTASETYLAWCWNAGGSTVTNTSGTISAQVRANTTSGFSIVTYTGTGANATVGHGIGTAPSMIFVKGRSGSGSSNSWRVYHSGGNASPASGALYLNSTSAFTTDATAWNSTAPTSNVFSLGTDAGVNSTGTYVAYCFAPVAGYSAFGSYTGNASADGPFVYLGFRPEFIMIKASSSTGDWVMEDVARSPYNVSTNYLVANATGTETTGQLIDFLSNGFKIRVAVSSAINGSGTTYIYAAFAETPFRYSLAR